MAALTPRNTRGWSSSRGYCKRHCTNNETAPCAAKRSRRLNGCYRQSPKHGISVDWQWTHGGSHREPRRHAAKSATT